MTEKLPKIVSAFSNNAITSKVFGIFLWNKKQWKTDKFALKLMYTFICFMYLLSPNSASRSQMSLKFGHFGRFLVFPSFFLPRAKNKGEEGRFFKIQSESMKMAWNISPFKCFMIYNFSKCNGFTVLWIISIK